MEFIRRDDRLGVASVERLSGVHMSKISMCEYFYNI